MKSAPATAIAIAVAREGVLLYDVGMHFTAPVISGSHRGKDLGFPTFNVDPANVDPATKHGIYAAWAWIEEKKFPAAVHIGERPVFEDSFSCEVHIIDQVIEERPENLTVELVKFLRGVEDFSSIEELVEQMGRDVEQAKKILGT